MRRWAGMIKNAFLQETDVVQWMKKITLPVSRQYYVAHANEMSPALVEQFATIANISVFTKFDVYASDSLAALAKHRELLAALEMAILVDTPGLFVGYGPSSLSFYVTEARSERGQQSLDYRIDAMQQDPYAHPPDSMVAQINAKTVVSRDSLVTIALWANVLTDEPYGGSGIFLNALGREFKRRGHTVIHNSHGDRSARLHILNQNSFPKARFNAGGPAVRAPGARVVMRTDGPFVLHRGLINQDRQLFSFIRDHVTDIIYQSEWSQRETETRALDRGVSSNVTRRVIGNAAEPQYFYPRASSVSRERGVLKLCFSSYSGSARKNNQLLLDLVPKIDSSRFSLTVIGAWDLTKPPNVNFLPKVPQEHLGEALRKHDVYLALSWNECFSNSEVQAIASGLPVVALNDSSHPEVVQGGGVLFGERGTHGSVDELVTSSVRMCSPSGGTSRNSSCQRRWQRWTTCICITTR